MIFPRTAISSFPSNRSETLTRVSLAYFSLVLRVTEIHPGKFRQFVFWFIKLTWVEEIYPGKFRDFEMWFVKLTRVSIDPAHKTIFHPGWRWTLRLDRMFYSRFLSRISRPVIPTWHHQHFLGPQKKCLPREPQHRSAAEIKLFSPIITREWSMGVITPPRLEKRNKKHRCLGDQSIRNGYHLRQRAA